VLQRQPNAATRKDQISWLRRALKLSESLHSIASELSTSTDGGAKVDARTLTEVTIYHLSLRAEVSFERSQWAETITDLAVRRRLLSTLSDAARDSYDQALAAEFIDSYDPLIRFAAYKLGRAESHDIDGVVADIDEEMQQEALPGVAELVSRLKQELGSAEMEAGRATLEDVRFAGEKVEMRSAEIVKVMVKVQEVLGRQKGKGKGMRGWDRVLAVLGEAEAVAKKLVDDHEVGLVPLRTLIDQPDARRREMYSRSPSGTKI
jgi:signal recognition particle subunit SRP68